MGIVLCVLCMYVGIEYQGLQHEEKTLTLYTQQSTLLYVQSLFYIQVYESTITCFKGVTHSLHTVTGYRKSAH